MLYNFTPIIYDCKIYMKQKSVDVDMTATKADVKAIYLQELLGNNDEYKRIWNEQAKWYAG